MTLNNFEAYNQRMLERIHQTSIDQAMAATRESLKTMVLTLEQQRSAFMEEQGRVIENDIYKIWAEVRELDLDKPVWQIVVNPGSDPQLIKLLDAAEYAQDAPEEFYVMFVFNKEGAFYIRKSDKDMFSETVGASYEQFAKYGLWSLRAMATYLEDQSKFLRRSQAYYDKLRLDLKERFGDKGLKKVENMGEISEEELLGYEESQVVLWVIGKNPLDLIEALKMYHSMVGHRVVSTLREYGYIDNGPVELTKKGKDYLASKEKE